MSTTPPPSPQIRQKDIPRLEVVDYAGARKRRVLLLLISFLFFFSDLAEELTLIDHAALARVDLSELLHKNLTKPATCPSFYSMVTSSNKVRFLFIFLSYHIFFLSHFLFCSWVNGWQEKSSWEIWIIDQRSLNYSSKPQRFFSLSLSLFNSFFFSFTFRVDTCRKQQLPRSLRCPLRSWSSCSHSSPSDLARAVHIFKFPALFFPPPPLISSLAESWKKVCWEMEQTQWTLWCRGKFPSISASWTSSWSTIRSPPLDHLQGHHCSGGVSGE